MLNLRMLGPMEASLGDRPVSLGPPQRRALLAALALSPGTVIGVDSLVAALWADRPPGSATNILQGHVARLRSVLEPGRGRGEPASVLVTRSPGYLLAVSAEHTDVGRFRRSVAEGRRAGERDPAAAAAILAEALALWRGEALADLGDLPVAVSARGQLAELRRTALAERIDADLAAGRDADLVAELEALVAADPLHERGHGQLMLALYRAGRAADALAAFASARRTLADELGLDPGPELRALEAAILRHEVPGPRSPGAVGSRSPARPADGRGGLPAALTSFVGRDAELAELRSLLAERRLVTLTGPGGAGKTRLAVELVGGTSDGSVHLVDLVPVAEDAAVMGAVAAALGIREEPGRSLAEVLAESLRAEPALLVLDNCEHLVDGCAALVDALLRAAPRLRVLATSRQSLGVVGETVWPVEGLAEAAAVRLFAERAAAAFRLSGDTRPVVARICRRLDGMPLAIELAAVRTRMLTAGEIEVRLADRFGLLSSARRGGPARHRTLSAVIDWSYQLLTEAERVLFEQLSVFAGDFGLAAAEAVAGTRVEDVLAELVDKSLVERTADVQGRARYRLLDTVRRFARDRLDTSGGTGAALSRHAAHFAALAEELTPLAARAAVPGWANRLLEDGSEFRAAVGWSLADGDGSDAATIMGAAWWLWWIRGPLTEGRELLEAALRVCADPTPPTRARLLYGAASITFAQADLECTERFGRECVETSRVQGDDLGVGWGLGALGLAAWARGDYPAGRRLMERVVECSRRSGDRWHEALGLAGLGRVAADQGADDRAEELLAESAALARQIRQPQALGFAMATRATIAYGRGRDDRAVELAGEALAAYREAVSPEGVGSAMRTIGLVALRRGDTTRAAEVLGERLRIYRRHGLRGPLVACLEDIAEVAVAGGGLGVATRLLAAADTLRREYGTPLPVAERERLERRLAGLRAGLAGADFASAWADGRAMTLDAAAATAAAVTDPGLAPPGSAARTHGL